MKIEDLEPFLGRWSMRAVAPWAEGQPDGAETVFEWLSGGRLLVQRVEIPVPVAPDSLAVIGVHPETEGFLQHYFDSRGVVRLYEMSFDGRTWELTRTKPDFSPLDFSQRFTGVFSDDGGEIAGRWEAADDGESWELDFELFYRRLE
ncbi:MAG TPA: hypothetical protein VGH24_07705 [Solirubrobacteraceae bacterium]|jgi:hypothetical protein